MSFYKKQFNDISEKSKTDVSILRNLVNSKQNKVQIHKDKPAPSNAIGSDGEIRFHMFRGILTMYVKVSGIWYSSPMDRLSYEDTHDLDEIATGPQIFNQVQAVVECSSLHATDARVVTQVPGIVLPENAIVWNVAVGVNQLSNLSTYDVMLFRHQTDGAPANTGLGGFNELLGADDADTAFSYGSGAEDVHLGTSNGQVGGMWICPNYQPQVSTGLNYVYVGNGAANSGTTQPTTPGVITVYMEYFSFPLQTFGRDQLRAANFSRTKRYRKPGTRVTQAGVRVPKQTDRARR